MFDNFEEFSDGLAWAEINGKFGCVDITGKVVIEPKFNKHQKFSEGLAWINEFKETGYILPKGYKSFKPREYVIGKKWGYINKNGDIKIPLEFDYAKNFKGCIAQVRIRNKYNFINEKGELLLYTSFVDIEEISKDLLRAELKKYQLIRIDK